MTAPWTTPADVAARVRRRWEDGSLLTTYASEVPFETIEVPLRGPKPSQIGDDLAAVRDWIAVLDAGRRDDTRYSLTWAAIGGRNIGRNQVPVRAIVSTYTQAWALLGAASQVRHFEEMLALAGDRQVVRAWLVGHPHRALEHHGEFSRLLAARDWLDSHRGSQRYLREISAPGVDTKFAEHHRATLAAMLGVPASPSGFLAGLGLNTKPEHVRLRPAPSLGLFAPLSEVAVRAEELAELPLAPSTALVVENEITFLSTPVPADGVVIWGKGFDVDRVGRLPWLAETDVVYWGDLDTHGFAILNRLRAWLPQSRSVLMDRETLIEHRDRWVREDKPTNAVLTRLTRDEQALYADLVTDALGERVRLEQERVDWAWAQRSLEAAVGPR